MSNLIIKITDESFAGNILNEISISISGERLTVKDIIEARVYAEVEDYNKRLPQIYRGLVQPTDAEVTLNGFKMRKLVKLDAEKQVYTALDAFQKNGFFLLVDHKQAESLDEEVLVSKESSISFVKLTPLVGG
jgi:hypothetical protein